MKLKEECNKKGHNNIKGKILLFIDFLIFYTLWNIPHDMSYSVISNCFILFYAFVLYCLLIIHENNKPQKYIIKNKLKIYR